MRLPALTWPQVLQHVALAALAAAACLSPIHNDTWWHLAYGREMATAGGFAQTDWFSHTAWGQPFPNHQWLGERVLYAAAAIGGLPLVTALCAAMIAAAWVLVWRLTRGAPLDRLLLTVAAASSSTLIWSVRPQAFTILMLPIVAHMVVKDRLVLLPFLFLLWANLHGGVLIGVIVLACAVAAAVLWRREQLARRALCLAAALAMTFVTPLGTRYWPEIFASLQRSQINRIHEWQQTPWPPSHLVFWIAAVGLVWLALQHRQRLSDRDGIIVLSALAMAPAATRTLRNVAPFMMLAAPAISQLVWTHDVRHVGRRAGVLGVLVTGGSAAGALAAVYLAWSVPMPRLGWQPLSDDAARAIQSCPDPLYNRYADGGPIIWFVPGKKVFLDSRQDPFPTALVEEATRVEQTGDYERLFSQHGIRCAAVPPASPTAAALVSDGWETTFRDEQWIVLARPGISARSAGPSLAP